MSDWISIDPLPQMLTPTQEYIKEQLAAGKTPQAIAHRLHLRADHVADEIYEIRKKECTMGKALTEEQKARILEMRARGKSYHSIAMAVGCAAQSAAHVCNAEKLKDELAAEQAADLPEPQEAPENLPEKKAEAKPGKINEDFDAAVDQMIADAKKDTVKCDQYESEDTSDTYQDTFAASAENKSTIAENESLPPVVRRAVIGHMNDLEMEIEMREQRIEELKAEIREFRRDLKALKGWKEAQRW